MNFHIDPALLDLLRAVAAVVTILGGGYGLIRIARRLWRKFRNWWTRPQEPAE